MDLSIIDRVFALRDAARKADLGANALDLSPLSRGDNARMEQPTGLPDDKVATKLMSHALELAAEANAKTVIDPRASAYVADLLAAASAPLPMFDESELANVDRLPAQPPAVVPPETRPPAAQPPNTRPPTNRAPVVPDNADTIIPDSRAANASKRPTTKRAAAKKKRGGSKKDKDK